MDEVTPFDIKSINDLATLNKEEIRELLIECEFYLEEADHYEFSGSQIEHLEETIELIESKLSGKEIDNSFQNVSAEKLLEETFKIAISSDFNGTMFPWFTLIRYENTTKKKFVNTILNNSMAYESFMVSEGLDGKIQRDSEQITAFTLCYEGEVEMEGKTFDAIIVELGVKGSDKSQCYYQRYSVEEGFLLVDPEPVKWVEARSRFKA